MGVVHGFGFKGCKRIFQAEVEGRNSMKRVFIHLLVCVPLRKHSDVYVDSVGQPLDVGIARMLCCV